MDFKHLLNKIKNDKGITLAVAWSFNQLAYAIVYPFIPLYLAQDRQIPYTKVSLIFPLLGLAVILAPIPCGWLTDKCGRAFMMLFGQLGRAVMFFLLAFFVFIRAPFWVFAVFLMINTAVGVAFQVGADAYLADNSTIEERPGYYGKIRIGFNVGWALGPMIGAFFANTPFWLLFIVTGLLCIAGTLYTKAICSKDTCRTSESNVVTEKKKDDFNVYTSVLCNFRFMMLLVGTLLFMTLCSQLYSTLSAFSTQRLGISKEALGSIYSLNGFMVLALQLPIVSLMKKHKIPVLAQLLTGTMLYIAGYLALGFSPGAAAVAAAVAVITLGEITAQPALYTSVSSETTENNAGRMLSVYTLVRGIGYAVGPWIGAQIFEATKSAVILWGSLAAFAAAAGVAFLFTAPKSKIKSNI